MLQRIWKWYNDLPNRKKTSITSSITAVGLIATIFTVLGVSVNGWVNNIWLSLLIVVLTLIGVYFIAYCIIGKIYKDSVPLIIRQTPVSISCGDIFETDGFRVIGCDTHFDTQVDDVVISKKSLHGKLVLEYGNADEIKKVVEKEAQRQHLSPNNEGLYDFPLGTVIRYDSTKDGNTYLMLAMTELDSNYEAHTNMAKFEHMLMKMWSEINRVYASNDVALPLLGTGISRFDDGPKNKDALLRCMLCTLNSSGVTLNAKIKVVIYGNAKDIPLYEYKDIFKSFQGR